MNVPFVEYMYNLYSLHGLHKIHYTCFVLSSGVFSNAIPDIATDLDVFK